MIYKKFRNQLLVLSLLTMQLLFTIGILSQSIDSKFLNQSVPDRMSPGQKYNLIVSYENSGRSTWIKGEVKLKVLSEEGKEQSVWSSNEFDLPKNIDPGSSVSFMIDMPAPSTEGVYVFTSQLSSSGIFFGERGKKIEVSVNREVGLSDAFNSSAFVEQTVPAVMEVGKPYKIMISYTNTGKTSWLKGKERLVMLDASGNALTGTNWAKISVDLDENIQPGGSKVFNFEIVPAEAGTYTLQWRMASSETGLFGDASNPAVIKVNPVMKKKNEGKSGKQ